MPTYGDFAIEVSHRFGYHGIMTDKIYLFAVGVIEIGQIEDEQLLSDKLDELYNLSYAIKKERQTIYKPYFEGGKVWVQ